MSEGLKIGSDEARVYIALLGVDKRANTVPGIEMRTRIPTPRVSRALQRLKKKLFVKKTPMSAFSGHRLDPVWMVI